MLLKKLNKYVRKRSLNSRRRRKVFTNTKDIVLFSGLGYEFGLEECISVSDYINKMSLHKDAQSSIICDIVREQCVGSVYIDSSNTMIMTSKSFEGVVDSINTTLQNLEIVNEEAYNNLINDTLTFFSERKVVVIQEGIQGAIYKAGRFVQGYGSTALTIESIMLSKVMGVTGKSVFAGQPLLYIALPTVGGIFFHGMSMVIGNNTVGNGFQTLGNILLMPMKGTELVLNNIVFLPLGKITGIPMLLNMTQAINTGPGLSIKDAKKMLDVVQKGKLSPLWSKIANTYDVWFKR